MTRDLRFKVEANATAICLVFSAACFVIGAAISRTGKAIERATTLGGLR